MLENLTFGQPVHVQLKTARQGSNEFVGIIIGIRGDFIKVTNETKLNMFPAFTYAFRNDVTPIREDSIKY